MEPGLLSPNGPILAVFAHPDDESILCGGYLATCGSTFGVDIHVLSLTHGELGPIADAGMATRETLGEVRAHELATAGHILGATSAECLAYPDGELMWANPGAVVGDLMARIRRYRPWAIITFDGQGLYWHPDHIATHRLVNDALRAIGAEGIHPLLCCATLPVGRVPVLVEAVRARGLPGNIWGLAPESFGVPEESITTVVDVRAFLDRKLSAIAAHRTQLEPGNLFVDLPADLAETYLGNEYFAVG